MISRLIKFLAQDRQSKISNIKSKRYQFLTIMAFNPQWLMQKQIVQLNCLIKITGKDEYKLLAAMTLFAKFLLGYGQKSKILLSLIM